MTPFRYDLFRFELTEEQFGNLAAEFFGRCMSIVTIGAFFSGAGEHTMEVHFNPTAANQHVQNSRETEASLMAQFGHALECFKKRQ